MTLYVTIKKLGQDFLDIQYRKNMEFWIRMYRPDAEPNLDPTLVALQGKKRKQNIFTNQIF